LPQCAASQTDGQTDIIMPVADPTLYRSANDTEVDGRHQKFRMLYYIAE